MKGLVVFPVVACLLLGATVFAADFSSGVDFYNKKDYASAYGQWKPLAELGYAEAQNNLGWLYQQGKGVKQDDEAAFKWYRLAAKQGNAVAQTNLGSMYENGAACTSKAGA
jgi:TPR repeat protein